MSLENDQSSSSCTEIEDVIFPEEIWILIWSHLDFKTLQKTCTCVSKSWLEMIRRSKLSWEMKLGIADMLEVKDFNAILSHWTDVREIQFSSEQDFAKFRLSLNSYRSLKKIVIPSLKAGTSLGGVTMYWIDPKHLLTPTDKIKNVIKFCIDVIGIPEEFAMRQDDCDFTNLETLEIEERKYNGLCSENVVPFLLRFKELKKVIIQHLEIRIDNLLDILSFLGDMKTLIISVSNLIVIHELDEEATKDIFNKALEIVNKKYPFPDVRILELNIYEDNDNGQPRHSIIYEEPDGATLYIDDVMSNSEYDTSDSESDTSDSMDEREESSDFMNQESVENSDTEDMN